MDVIGRAPEEILGLPVIDRTGLRGIVDLELKRRANDRDASSPHTATFRGSLSASDSAQAVFRAIEAA